MTDKEEIIIDEVNVKDCKRMFIEKTRSIHE